MQKETFEIKLPLFEGPFDLLLFFIERDELDIHDIPISKITNDFLDYVKQLEAMNIEVASEFILVAATLMQIKAKMLLPRVKKDEFGNEIDPREDLIKHLLEYKKYKSVIPELSQLESDRAEKYDRGNTEAELMELADKQQEETNWQDLTLYKLLRVYQKVMKRYQLASQELTHTVVRYPYTIEQQKEVILAKLWEKQKLSFAEILQIEPIKIAVVYNFLAVLELFQAGVIYIHIGIGYNNFWIEKFAENPEPVEQVIE
jgi:segregation and condensation protein A